MVKTNAEYVRKHREKQRNDPQQHASYLAAKAAAAKRYRAKQKENMSEADLDLKRKYEREGQRTH